MFIIANLDTSAEAETATRPAVARPVPPVAEIVTAPDDIGM